VIQLVLHLHVCADPTPIEPTAAGVDYATDMLLSLFILLLTMLLTLLLLVLPQLRHLDYIT
jgi:hypothetical protein